MTGSSIATHHLRQELCTSRPLYRDGRKLTAVKVYTIHQESQYLLVQNVPAVGARDQLAKLFSTYGTIADLHPLDDYPAENFTEVYRIRFQRIQSARFAKKKLDDYSFFGGSLHVSYAPEFETVQETRQKLQDRRRVIAAKLRQLEKESTEANKPPARRKHTDTQDGNRLTLPAPPDSTEFPHQQLPHLLPSLPPPPPPSVPPSPPSRSATLHSHQVNHSHPNFPHPVPSAPSGSLPPQHRHSWQGSGGVSNVGETGHLLQNVDLTIPPPPVPNRMFHASQHRTRKDYGFAWVPSANSAFPPGYDPRLPQESTAYSVGERTTGHSGPCSSSSSGSRKESSQRVSSSSLTSNALVPSGGIQVSALESGSKFVSLKRGKGSEEKVLVKEYKPKGPPPRFVPRQVKDKKEPQRTETVTSQKRMEKDDGVNREIRKEAFRLGSEQGPLLPEDPEVRDQLLGQRPLVEPKVEASVNNSVKAIRKRLSQFISETVPKKMKAVNGNNGKRDQSSPAD